MGLLLQLAARSAALNAGSVPAVPAGLTAIPTGPNVTSLAYLVNSVLSTGDDYTVSPGETLLVDMLMVTGTHSLGQLNISQGGAIFFDWRRSTKLIAAGVGNWGKCVRQIPYQRRSVVELNGAPPTVSGNPSALRGGLLGSTPMSTVQAVSGTLSIAVAGTTYTSNSFSLSSAATLTQAAAIVQAAFSSPPFAVTFDWASAGLVVTSTAAGAGAPAIAYPTGAVAAALKLTQDQGARFFQGGGALVRGITHVNAAGTTDYPANLLTGNNSTTNDYGGVSRQWIDYEGHEVVEEGMVGAPYEVTWCRLDGDVQAGGHVLKTSEPVSWQVGWKIALGSTRRHGTNGAQSQILTIESIEPDGRTIHTVEPFDDWRFGRLQYAVDALDASDNGLSFTMAGRTFTEGPDGLGGNMKSGPEQTTNVLEMRAIVGRCDSNMVCQAPDDAHWKNGFGFGRMRMGIAGRTRRRHMHTQRYGQRALLGRYGDHDHLNGYDVVTGLPRTNPITGLADGMFAPGQSLREHCSFDDGQNRGAVLHTCRNSAWDQIYIRRSLGNSFHMETGAETKNRVRNVVGVDPVGAGQYALKMHERGEPTGVWVSNFDNELFNYGGVGCSGGGFWHAPSTGLENGYKLDRQHGCLNESASIPVAPFFSKQGAMVDPQTGDILSAVQDGGTAEGMFGEYCRLIGRTNDIPVDCAGNTTQGKIQTTTDGVAGPEYGNPNQTYTLLVGLRGHGCSEPYNNRIAAPLYLRPVTSDIQGETFHGQTDFGLKVGHIAVARSLYPFSSDIVDRDGVPPSVSSPYHGTFGNLRSSSWGYGGGPIVPKEIEAYFLKGSAVETAWDAYFEPLIGNYMGLAETGHKLCKSDYYFKTPSPNLIGTPLYADTASLYAQDACDPVRDNVIYNGQPMRRHYHLGGARLDIDGTMSSGSGRNRVVGRPGYIIYKAPFLTYGAGPLIDLPGDPYSANAVGPFFGMKLIHDSGPRTVREADGYVFTSDPASETEMTPNFRRLDPANLAAVPNAVWNLPGPARGGNTINTNVDANHGGYHFAYPNGGWVEMNFLEQPEGFNSLQLYFTNFFRSTDNFGLKIPKNGGAPTVVQQGTVNIPQATSKEDMRTSTTRKWWYESGWVYVKFWGNPAKAPPSTQLAVTTESLQMFT